jgi:hypothetical protein
MRWRLVTLAVPATLAFTTAAWAEPPVDAAAAQALFERGRSAADKGDWPTACNAFAESQRLDPGAGTLMNWAVCEVRQNKLASAWQHLNEAAALLKPGDDRAPFVRAQLRKLSPRLPRLTLRLKSDAPATTRIERSGTELSPPSIGIPLPIDPGELELVVTCPGRKPRRALVSVHEGEQLDLTLEPGDELDSTLTTRSGSTGATQSPSNWQRGLGISLVAAGSLGVGLALASGVMVQQRQRTTDQHCPHNRCDAVGFRAAESGERWLTVNTLAWSLGGAALLGGATLWLVAPSEKRDASIQPWPGGAAFVYAEHY